MKREELKENVVHGTVSFPLGSYEWNEEEKGIVHLHWHEETEIMYLKEGSFILNINMKEYKVSSPSLVFINSGVIHSIESVGKSRESALVFDLKMLSFEHFDASQYKIISPLIKKQIQFPHFIYVDDKIWNSVKELYEKISLEATYNKLSSYMKAKGYLYELIGILYENNMFLYEDKLEEINGYNIENVKKVLSFIQDNYNNKITLEEAASVVGMNTQYFCRYFKKLLGKTLTEYINEVRVEKAVEYLIESDYKIIDVAVECGYDNIGYFIKRFKEIKGVSPSEYRKKNKKSK